MCRPFRPVLLPVRSDFMIFPGISPSFYRFRREALGCIYFSLSDSSIYASMRSTYLVLFFTEKTSQKMFFIIFEYMGTNKTLIGHISVMVNWSFISWSLRSVLYHTEPGILQRCSICQIRSPSVERLQELIKTICLINKYAHVPFASLAHSTE